MVFGYECIQGGIPRMMFVFVCLALLLPNGEIKREGGCYIVPPRADVYPEKLLFRMLGTECPHNERFFSLK